MRYNLGIILLSVRDLPASREFYSLKLGLPVVPQLSDDHFVVVALANGGLVGLSQLAPDRPLQSGAVELGLEVPDVDAAWREWQAAGLVGMTAPADTDFGRSFDAHDPDGHPLSIYQLRPPVG